MASRFVLNRSFRREFSREAQLRRFMKNLADRGAREAQRFAPRSDGDGPHYADSIQGVLDTDGTEVVGRIEATDWKAAIIELHGVNDGRGPLAPLRKGAESLNLRVERGRR